MDYLIDEAHREIFEPHQNRSKQGNHQHTKHSPGQRPGNLRGGENENDDVTGGSEFCNYVYVRLCVYARELDVIMSAWRAQISE